MSSKVTILGPALAALLVSVSQVAAGGRAVSCYAEVHQPAVYRTVHEEVMVHPGSRHVEVTPAVYGTRSREVLIEPERVTYRVIPAEYATVHEKALIRPGGTSWQWKHVHGKRIWCEVEHPPVYGTVARTVIVRPAQKERFIIPARYGYVSEEFQLRPPRQHVVETPPVYRTVARKVLVQEARTGWRPVGVPRHCRY